MDWLAIILKALGLTAWAERFLQQRADQAVGQMKQENADLKAANDALRRQNQAQADAPTTRTELEELLKEGKL